MAKNTSLSASEAAYAVKHAYALIIGIGNYQDEEIRKLKYTREDAKAVYNLVTDPSYVGLPKENVKLLLDKEASLRNIKKAISVWLFEHAGTDSTVVVFFAGHGGLESDKTRVESDGIAKYLLPWDTDHKDLFSTALSNTEFNRLLKAIQSPRVIVFLDACFASGVASKGARDIGLLGNPYKSLLRGKGRLVIASAQPKQRSWEHESLGHGVFSYHLLEAIKGKADTNRSGYVSVLDLFNYLRREVPKTVRRLANSLQEPMLIGEASDEIVFAINQKRIAEIELNRKKEHAHKREAIRKKRHALFELNEDDKLPLEAYQEALQIIEKDKDRLDEPQRMLAEHIELLSSGNMNPELYLATRKRILAETTGKPRPSETPPNSRTPEDEQHTKPQERHFCTECGAQLVPGNRFCLMCGKPVEE